MLGDMNKELFDPIVNSLKLHPGFFSDMRFVWSQYQIPDIGQDVTVLFSLALFTYNLSLNFRSISSQSECRLFSGLWEMWKNIGCRQRGFSKRLWKSMSASDFHKCVIFHQSPVSTYVYSQILLKTLTIKRVDKLTLTKGNKLKPIWSEVETPGD